VTATHCAKTLVAAAAAGNVALQHCVKYLIPGVVLYLTTVAGRNRGDGGAQSDAESDVQGVESLFGAVLVIPRNLPCVYGCYESLRVLIYLQGLKPWGYFCPFLSCS
jgi:hypothetical protein